MSKTKIALCVALVAAGCRAFDDANRGQVHSDPYEAEPALHADSEPYAKSSYPAAQADARHGQPVSGSANVSGNPTEGNSTLESKPQAAGKAEVPGNPTEGNSALGTKSSTPSSASVPANPTEGKSTPAASGTTSGTTSTGTKSPAATTSGSTGSTSGATATGAASTATTPKAGSASTPLSEAEKRFVQQAYSAGMFEVESSQWAMSRLTDTEDREAARVMIGDHTQANQELANLALRHGMQVGRTLLPEHARMLEELRSAPADEQGKAYEKVQLKAHQEAIALFENAARTCESADLKAFAEKSLPTLRKHLKHFDDDADDEDDDKDDDDDDDDMDDDKDEDTPPKVG